MSCIVLCVGYPTELQVIVFAVILINPVCVTAAWISKAGLCQAVSADPRSSYFIPHWWKANMKRCFDQIINLSWLFSLAYVVPSLGAGCYLNRLPGNLRSGVLYVFPTSSQKLSQCICRALNSLSVFNQSKLVSFSLPVEVFFAFFPPELIF